MKKVTLLFSVFITLAFSTNIDASDNEFECDGRKYCSQMTSCEEALYFLKNCPDPRMDGNNDGVPCEKQWCDSTIMERIKAYLTTPNNTNNL